MKKVKIGFVSLIILLMGIFSICFVFPSFVSAEIDPHAEGDGLVCTLSVDKSIIKTTEVGSVVNLTITIENNTGKSLYGGQVDIQVDPEIFEVDPKVDSDCGLVSSPDLLNTYVDANRTKLETGLICLAGDNLGQPISATKWMMAGYKLKVKKPATDFSSITMSHDRIPDMLGVRQTVTFVGDNTEIKFEAPSNECDVTNLTSTQNGVSITKSGDNFVATVPYSISTLDTAALKPIISQGATISYSPNGKVALNVGENTITMTVTAEDGVTNKQVNLIITRSAGEEINTLSSLIVKNGNNNLLSKTGDQLSANTTDDLGVIAYEDRGNLSVVTTKNGSYSTVEIQLDGTTKYTGTVSETSKTLSLGTLTAGSHTLKVVAKSQVGANTEYIVTFTVQAPATENRLSSLILKDSNGDVITLDKEFDADVTDYTVTLPAGASLVSVDATAKSEGATITGNGDHNVPAVIEIIVTAQDGSTKKYTVTVNVESGEPVKPQPDDNKTNSKIDTFPYILGLIILGVNNIVAFIIIAVVIKQKKKNDE